jgi:hypothetical protein
MKFLVWYEIEADSKHEVYDSIRDADDPTVVEIKGDLTDRFPFPGGRKVIVGMADGTFIIANVTGWCLGSCMFTAAQHLNPYLLKDEMAMIASQITAPPTRPLPAPETNLPQDPETQELVAGLNALIASPNLEDAG